MNIRFRKYDPATEFRRMVDLGAEHVHVQLPQPFYRAIGFRKKYVLCCNWQKN